MPLSVQRALFDRYICVTSAVNITTGFTIALPAPCRGELVSVFLSPVDGTAITAGPATLTVSVQNISVGTLSLVAAAIGFASGGDFAFSPRAFVQAGDGIKLVLGAGLTNGAFASIVLVVRERTA
jgi:hypothetical protein